MFSFNEQGDLAAICYDGQPILELKGNYMPFGYSHSVQNQVLEPGGKPAVAFLPLFATHGYGYAVNEVRCEVVEESAGRFSMRVIPTSTKGGDGLKRVAETVTLTVALEDGRFVWTQGIRIEFLQDLDLSQANNKSPVRVYRFPKRDGSPGRFLQFADPMPANASGPAVPMTRDWVGVWEPTVGPDSFRKHWKRDITAIIYPNTDGSFSWTELIRQKTHAMQADNLCARECDPKGSLYLVKASGEALEYRVTAPSHYHHICEWGMDFHCWLDLDDFAGDGKVAAGTVIEAETILCLVPREKVDAILETAKPIELTEEDKLFFDHPAYEEPARGALRRGPVRRSGTAFSFSSSSRTTTL